MGKQSIKHQSLSQAFYNGELGIKTTADKRSLASKNVESQNVNDLTQKQQDHAKERTNRKVVQFYPKAQTENSVNTTINPVMRFLTLKSLILKQSTE
ncbi:MAG: hypothetical protein K0U68_07935 [Gammaproteobacteria bacterium]|nr:hypothetical protein [Gammaproteobacteria bacterium]